MGGISIWQLLIIAVIVVLLFGTKKLRGMGGDLGSAVKGFKEAMKDDNNASKSADEEAPKELTEQKTSAEKEAEKEKDKGQG